MTRKHKSDGDRSKVGSSLLVVGGLRSHCGDGEMGETWRIRDKNKNKLITIIVGKTQIHIENISGGMEICRRTESLTYSEGLKETRFQVDI